MSQMLGIAVLIVMFGVYLVANLWAQPRGSRRKHSWIEDCDLSDPIEDFVGGHHH